MKKDKIAALSATENVAERTKKPPFGKFINLRLSVFAAGATIAGIFCAKNFVLQETFAAVLFLLSFLILCAVFLIFYTEKAFIKRNLLFTLVLAVLFTAGGTAFTLKFNAFSSRGLGGHYYTVTGNVCSKTETSYGTALEIKNAFIEGVYKGETGYKIVLTAEGKTTADVGDKVRFDAFLTEYSVVYDGKFSASRVSDGVKYRAEISASDIEILSHSPDIFQATNLFIKRSLQKGMTGDEFGVAYAMLTGGSSYIDEDLLSAYRELGIAHIFAVSGLHIGFFSAALSLVLKKCRANRFVTAAVVILASFFYSGVCGFSSSSVRAAIMCSVAFLASLSGKRYDGLSSLGVAATLVLLLNPAELFNAGFVLSFTVVAGLLVVAPSLTALFKKFLPQKLASSLAAVFAAFSFSVPVLFWCFGQISFLSVFANLVLLPFVGVLYVALFALTVISGVIGANTILLFLPSKAIEAISFVVTYARKAALIVTGAAFGGCVVFWYASLVVASGLVNLKRLVRTVVSLSLAGIFVAFAAVNLVEASKSTEVYICGNGKVSAAIIKTPEGNSLVLAKYGYGFSPNVIFRAAERKGISKLDAVYMLGGGGADAQVVLTSLRHGFTIETLVYYGERDEELEEVIRRSFGDVAVFAMKDGGANKRGGAIVSYLLNGYAVEVKTKKFFAAITGEFGENGVGYTKLYGGYDLIVCHDKEETINALYAPKKFYSFAYSERFTNVISSGIIALRF